jgi:hypothetical protein
MKYDCTEVEQLTDNQWEDGGPRATDRVSGKLNLLKKTTFYDLRVSQFTRVYMCPVFGARGNRYNVSEVENRRDRSNELYEEVAALA